MTSEQVASAEQVSTTEPVSPEGIIPPVVVTPPILSPEEILNQKIAEAVAKALAPATDKYRREIQSVKDKAVAEVQSAQRRAKLAEGTLISTRTHLQTLDPDVAKEMELAEYRAKEQGRLTMEQEEQAAQYQANVVQGFNDRMSQFITGLGLNPADPKIDWATDAPDLLTKMGRIQDSVAKIQKENIQTIESGLEKRLKDLENKAKQANVEANSVSTATSPGVVVGSDAEFVKKFASGELPLNKANKERYEKIQQSY